MRIIAVKQVQSGRSPARQGASGRWPTDRGIRLTSPNMVLQAMGRHLSGRHRASAEGASDPLQLKASAATFASAANTDSRARRGGIIGKEAWKKAWAAPRKGKNRGWQGGGGGIRIVDEDMTGRVTRDVNIARHQGTYNIGAVGAAGGRSRGAC